MKKLSDINKDSWKEDCRFSAIVSLTQDLTTTKDNLREKACNFVSNYIAFNVPGITQEEKEKVKKEIADEIEKNLEKTNFMNEPPASKIARDKRIGLGNEPENRFIRLR